MTLEKEVQTLDERLSAAGYKDKAPAAVVEKAEAELSDKRLQFKTVSDSIESMLAQVPTKKNCMPRFLRPLYTRPHATRYECYYIPEYMCLPRPSMTRFECMLAQMTSAEAAAWRSKYAADKAAAEEAARMKAEEAAKKKAEAAAAKSQKEAANKAAKAAKSK